MLALEGAIMAEIGLGMHFTWHNGSSGCAGTRQQALRKLPRALRRHNVAPIRSLLAFLRLIERHEDRRIDALTHTWQATSAVIRAHLEVADAPEHQGRIVAAHLAHLRDRYRLAAAAEGRRKFAARREYAGEYPPGWEIDHTGRMVPIEAEPWREGAR